MREVFINNKPYMEYDRKMDVGKEIDKELFRCVVIKTEVVCTLLLLIGTRISMYISGVNATTSVLMLYNIIGVIGIAVLIINRLSCDRNVRRLYNDNRREVHEMKDVNISENYIRVKHYHKVRINKLK